MKVGLFISRAGREGAICAFDLVRFVRSLGEEMALYCPGLDPASDASLWVRFDRSDWTSPGWWARARLDLAIFYGITGFPAEVLRAARQSGATVVVEGDTDGRVSPAQNLPERLASHWDSRTSWGHRLRAAKAGLDLWLWRRGAIEREVLACLGEADFIKVESTAPAAILKEFLRSRGRPELADRVVEIPFAVRECFTELPVPEGKEDTVVIAGRLGEIQKGPLETVEAIRQLLLRDPGVRIEVHLRGELTAEFAALAAGSPRLRICENTTREQLAERLRGAAVLFSRSRWETTPVIALEALCSGCTLVAPEGLPGYRSLIEGERFGRTYPGRSTRAAVEAILTELGHWRAGRRDGTAIARHWRARASLRIVAGQLLELRASPSPAEAHFHAHPSAGRPAGQSIANP